ncbi:Ig-like domain repeat protein [Actinoplanes hulinensis]|uniref:Ig-like domain repeat protein n=1 Tax=Actinoplanes hulinensis TaxID=1144547 RepID=A0ABS7BGL0_9ACTN|nr:Ig-like domain-containing protein [Actinoplanes hulinensis]MBW6440029.1 Ig-like domain repeat protein [Actinoplanes hulinensis]
MAAILINIGLGAPAAHAAAAGDTTAPTIADIGIAAGTLVNGTVALHPVVADDVAVTRVELRANNALVATSKAAPFTLSWDSRKHYDINVLLRLTAFDAAGNSVTSDVVTVHVDNDAPFITFPWYFTDSIKQNPDMSFTGTVAIDFTKWGLDADTAGIELSIGDKVIGTRTSAPWVIDWDTSAYNGRTTLTARGWDTFGNTYTARSTVWADHTGPTITPRFNWTPDHVTGGGQIHTEQTDGAWIRKVELLVNGTLVATNTIGDSKLVTFTWPKGIPNGPATMTIRAEDMIGNVSEHTRTVIVDNDAPTATVSPATGSLLHGTATASLTNYRDATGVVYFSAGLGDRLSATAKAPWRTAFDTTWHPDGRQTLTCYVVDKAGNTTVITRAVTVDNTAPAVAMVKAPRNNTTLRKAIRINAAARDAHGIARVQLLVNGKVIATDTTSAYRFTLNPKKFGKKFTVQVRAYDRAGNVKYTAKRTYRR